MCHVLDPYINRLYILAYHFLSSGSKVRHKDNKSAFSYSQEKPIFLSRELYPLFQASPAH